MLSEIVLSPSCGQITDISLIQDDPGLNGYFQRISIFLALWDNHTNLAPVKGDVEFVQYTPGRFHWAFDKKSLKFNENNLIGIRAGKNHIAVRQIAGKVARRIVCDVKPGQSVQAGQIIGRIKFGSCVQLYLPRLFKLNVRVGQKMTAGKSTLAVISETHVLHPQPTHVA